MLNSVGCFKFVWINNSAEEKTKKSVSRAWNYVFELAFKLTVDAYFGNTNVIDMRNRTLRSLISLINP